MTCECERSVKSARRVCRVVVAALLVIVGPAHAWAANIVVEWNATAIATALAAREGALPQTRSMAIVAVAVNDAVNAITRRHAIYGLRLVAPPEASVDAAVAGAAHRALVLLYPSQALAVDAALTASLATHGVSASDPAIAFGELVADETVAGRTSDGASAAQFPYVAPGAGSPGVWVPTPPARLPAALPGWGRVTPWVLRDGSQFRPDEGPSLTSGRYARDFDEIRAFGSATSAIRTPEQTNIALFWLTSAAVIWDGALREVATARGLDESDTAHAFALVNLAGADAGIACWDAKYTFNFWRPVTAIAEADADGNPDTTPDSTWTPLAPTPNFPEFPSGHAVVSGAMGTMLRLLFGDNPGEPFTVSSPTNPGFTRTWPTFSTGIDEVVNARVWTGFHFRSSDEEGARIGRQVAQFVFQHALRDREPHDR